jgi:HEAT repeat protein
MLRAHDQDARALAVALTAAHWDSGSSLPALLADPDPDVRAGAVAALARIPGRPHLDLIVRALDDSAAPVRIAALIALRDYRADATKHLARIAELASDRDPGVRGEVATTLGVAREREASQTLVTLLDDPDERVQVRAIYGIKNMAYTGASPLLARLAESDRAQVKQAAILTLEVLGAMRSPHRAARR